MKAMTLLRKAALFGLAAGLLAGPALADIPLVVQIDHSSRLTVAGSAASVLVGNPNVADVTVVDSHTLFIQGRSYGETDVVVLNDNGDTLYAGDIVVAGPASNRVSVYRAGAERMDLSCAPSCQIVKSAGAGGSAAGGAPAAQTGGNPVAAAGNLGAAAAATAP
jgi:hypothetical protein